MFVPSIKLLLTATLVVCTPMTVYGQTNGATARKPEVVEFKVTGVKSFEKSDLLRNLAIEQSHCKSAALSPVCWISKSPTFYQRVYIDPNDVARDVIRARVFTTSVAIGKLL